MERIIKRLVQNNIQPSQQRIKILQVLENETGHPNVNDIFDKVSKEMPTISKTTIYNTLNTFEKKGLIHSLAITSEETRYEPVTKPHHHLICKKCGRIIDVEVSCVYAQRQEVDGHRIDEVEGYFKGVCRDCTGREESADSLKRTE